MAHAVGQRYWGQVQLSDRRVEHLRWATAGVFCRARPLYPATMERSLVYRMVDCGHARDSGAFKPSPSSTCLAHHGPLVPFGWLVPHDVYRSLGRSAPERVEAYRALFGAALDPDDIAANRLHANKCCALGDARFQELIAAMASRRAHVAPVGRPRRNAGNWT